MSDKVDNHAERAGWWAITLEYASAAGAVVLALLTLSSVAAELCMLLANGSYAPSGGGGLVMVVSEAVLAVMFSLVALILYKRVSKRVAASPEYVHQASYHIVTNALVAYLVYLVLTNVATLVGILLSSLFLIGSGADYGTIYLGQFLPTFITGATAFVALLAAFKIMKGKNLSFLMTIVLLSVTGAVFLASAIVVPIKAHSNGTAATQSMTNIDTYLKDLNSNY